MPQERLSHFGTNDLHAICFETSNHIAFAVEYGDLPKERIAAEDVETFKAIHNKLIATGGKISAEKLVRIGDLQGYQLEFVTASDGNVHLERLFVAKGRLYQVWIAFHEENRGAKEIERFLDSFTLLNR